MDTNLEQIKPETIALIVAQAKASGLSVDEYLKSLLSKVAESKTENPLYETASPEELSQAFVGWAESHDKNTPPLTLEDISRESIYEDH